MSAGEKPKFLERIKRRYRGLVGEMKKVHWPSKKELSAYTTVVIIAVIIVGAAIWIVDSGIGFLMGLILK